MTYQGVRALQRAGVRAADVIVRHADIRPADLQPTKRKVMALGKSKPLTRDEALVRMAGLCARSEQCASDIARKLRTKGLSSADIASVIDELKERSFLDEARYARSFARDKVWHRDAARYECICCRAGFRNIWLSKRSNLWARRTMRQLRPVRPVRKRHRSIFRSVMTESGSIVIFSCVDSNPMWPEVRSEDL